MVHFYNNTASYLLGVNQNPTQNTEAITNLLTMMSEIELSLIQRESNYQMSNDKCVQFKTELFQNKLRKM